MLLGKTCFFLLSWHKYELKTNIDSTLYLLVKISLIKTKPLIPIREKDNGKARHNIYQEDIAILR